MPGTDLLENLLRECARQRPTPVFPAELAQATGMNLEQIEAAFDHLRTMKLVFLTDWIQGHGRGFIITEDGVHVLNDHVLLDRLRYQPVSPEPGVLSSRPTPREVEMGRGHEEALPPATEPVVNRAVLVQTHLMRPGQPIVTYILVLSLVAVFLIGLNFIIEQKIPTEKYLGVMPPDVPTLQVLHRIGLLVPSDVVVEHEWWKMWGYAFVQGWGVLGLFLSMWYLYSLGSLSEAMWGHFRLAGLFFTCVLGGSCAALFYGLPAWNILAADWGMLAAQAVWLIGNHAYLPKEAAAGWKRSLISNLLFHVIIYVILITQANVGAEILAIPVGGAAAGLLFAVPALMNRYYAGAPAWVGLAAMMAVPATILIVVASSFDAIKEAEQRRRVQAQRQINQIAAGTPHHEALKAASAAFNHAEPILNDDPRKALDNAERTHDAKIAAKEACVKLKTAIAFLEQGQPMGKLTPEALAGDRKILAFFESFLTATERRKVFVEKRNELRNEAIGISRIIVALMKQAR
jgi:membrane associated rhomboid family serine protease